MSNLAQQFPSRNVFLISSNQPDSFFVFEIFVVYEASFLYLSLIRLGFFKVVFLGINLTRFPLYISWKANRQYQFNIIKLLKQPTQRGMKAKKLSWHDMSSADVISIFCYKKMSKKKIDENRSYWRRKSSYLPNDNDIDIMSMTLLGMPSPTHLPTPKSLLIECYVTWAHDILW